MSDAAAVHADPTIFIVDENTERRCQLRAHIERAHFLCDESENQQQALEKLESLSPSVIILDIARGTTENLELCRQLRSNIRFAHVPILALTQHDDMEATD